LSRTGPETSGGDRVLSRDQFDPDGPLVWSEVERVFVAATDTVLRITLENGRSLELTPEHVIWIDEVGWVEARQVVVGDTMRLSDDEERSPIASLRYERKEALTYNIQVAGTRTFFVDGVWVHNASCSIRKPWRVTPEGTQQTLRHPRFGKFFQSKSDGLWWSRDTSGHGGSFWKVFTKKDNKLHWQADADEYGDFIIGKHKGPVGTEINLSEMKRVD
jgi:hypothetical protein